MDEVSILLIPKSNSNHARIGSRTERLRVLKIAVIHVIFSYFFMGSPKKISSGSQFRRMKSWVGHCSKSLMSSINLEQASRYLSSHFLNVAAFSRLIKISSCGYPFISTFNL